MSQALSTTDHNKIKEWAEERNGQPATVAATKQGDDDVGILRIDFPGYSGEESLEAVSWEEFFEAFEENNLEFLYQEKTDDGELSRFCKFVRRHTAE